LRGARAELACAVVCQTGSKKRGQLVLSTIETIGEVVRGPYGSLSRITAVLEESRLSERHVSSPGDVVVTLERVGPGYGHESAWASTLKPSKVGDVGAHPCRGAAAGCLCGHELDGWQPFGWQDRRESWATV
jgi:hypothetical protein